MQHRRLIKLTPELQSRICDAIRAGNYIEVAAGFGGIDPSTFHRWRARGQREQRGPYRAFFLAVQKAERDAEVALVAVWRKNTNKNWQASATLLARRFPARWSHADVIESRVEEELRARLAFLRKRLDEPTLRRVVEALLAEPTSDDE